MPRRHTCKGEDCGHCQQAIEEAEYLADHPDPDHADNEADAAADRYERWMNP